MLTYIVPQPGVADFVELGMWAVKYLLTSMPPPPKETPIPKKPCHASKPSLKLFHCEVSFENVNHMKLAIGAKENRQLDSIPQLRISP